MHQVPENYMNYWGKAGKGAENMKVHLLPYHCLDVAAICHVLLNQHRRLRSALARMVGLEENQFMQCMVFFLALHDIGKFAECFQNLRGDLLKILQGRESNKDYGLRHDTLGFLLWRERIRPYLLKIEFLPENISSRRRQRETGYDYWMRAIAGHHGEPPKEEDKRILDFFIEQDMAAAENFIDQVVKLLYKEGEHLPEVNRAKLRTASWWLAGLSVLCDWLGSNTEFFSACSNPMPLDKYWSLAVKQAELALVSTELLVETSREELSLQELFAPDIEAPTPLQAICGKIAIGEHPGLYILEDVTGAGKTEAAVLLAHRLMAHGRGTGVYIALPTMATANAMFERMQAIYQRLFPPGTQPSLVLAHSARNLSKAFRQAILPDPKTKEEAYGDRTVPASVHCSAWLADNSKKALLAAVGVGTVDQALLGILPSRHQGLRLLGLMEKILAVDEVHACDAYMHALLKVLLRAHAAAGGNAILLSATLPNSQRQALLNAFAEGMEKPPVKIRKTSNEDYPLLTYFTGDELQEIKIDTRKEVRRYVQVALIHEMTNAEEVVLQAVESGRCVCWIRNTVAEARQGYTYLRRKYPTWSIDLFHARFALADRLAIEDRIIKDFGKKSTANQRAGRVVVATQVVEQSLDIDFDVMITDLAPVDLVIQRAGRLCRHCRDSNGNRINGLDERGTPVLYVLTPKPIDQPKSTWLESLFPRGNRVYPNHGQLWLTARLLEKKKGFRVPEDVRTLTESVFGDEAGASIPEGLYQKTFEAEGQNWANISVAELNALKLSEGYSAASSNRWWDEALTPTRLGELTTTVYLGNWENGRLRPWNDGELPWQQSAVRIRTAHIAEEATQENEINAAVEQCKLRLPAEGKWSVLLPLIRVEKAMWRGIAKNEKGELVGIYYNHELGLIMEEEMAFLNGGETHESD